MAFKEAFSSTIETEKEVQRFITYLKEHGFNSERHINNGNYIKSYKEEVGIESQLKALNVFFQREVEYAEQELAAFKESVSVSCLKNKCRSIERCFQMFSDEEDDYGDED